MSDSSIKNRGQTAFLRRRGDVDRGGNTGWKADAFLPNFCGITPLFAAVLGGQLLAIVLVLARGWPQGQIWAQISLMSLYVQWIVLICAAVLCIGRRWMAGYGDAIAGVAAWSLVFLVTGVVAVVTAEFGYSFAGLPYFESGGEVKFVLRSLGVSGIVGALVLRYLYLDRQWRRQVIAQSEARFEALQARIRPHFLFNSMNTVASLTRSDPRQAEKVVEDLADLFRAALSDPEGGSTLGRELELVRQYLGVEQQRLGRRLRLEWDLQQLPEQAPLPLLVLQPLVENAVYHGVEPNSDVGVVRIAGRFREQRVNLSVRNSLPAVTSAQRLREGNHMALDNVRQRLAAMFSEHASLTVSRVEDEFQVRIVFPYP